MFQASRLCSRLRALRRAHQINDKRSLWLREREPTQCIHTAVRVVPQINAVEVAQRGTDASKELSIECLSLGFLWPNEWTLIRKEAYCSTDKAH